MTIDINKEKMRNILETFEIITSKGSKQNNVYQFSGMRAWHDFDGYICWLAYKDLTITLLFHGKYQLDYKNNQTLTDFFKKSDELLATKT
jgi:hypothetical protein